MFDEKVLNIGLKAEFPKREVQLKTHRTLLMLLESYGVHDSDATRRVQQ